MLTGRITAKFHYGEIIGTRYQDRQPRPFPAENIHEYRKRGGILFGRGIAPKIQHDAGRVQFANGFGQSRFVKSVSAETQVHKIGIEFSLENRLARATWVGRASALSDA